MENRVLEVHFIALPFDAKVRKSGDCQLVLFPDGSNMVIDCGIAETYPALRDYLLRHGIERIDTFLMSHPHIDHIGAFPSLIDDFPISRILGYPLDYFSPYETVSMKKMKESLERHGKVIEPLRDGMKGKQGGVEIRILNPAGDFPHDKDAYERKMGRKLDTTPGEDMIHLLNDCSVCARLDWGASSFLTCGDLYFTGEDDLIARHGRDLHVTLAKANHHGAYTSNTKEWIEAVEAKVVVAQQNALLPSFPEKDVRRKYFSPRFSGYSQDEYPRRGSAFFLTRKDGTVVVRLFHDGTYEITTERGAV